MRPVSANMGVRRRRPDASVPAPARAACRRRRSRRELPAAVRAPAGLAAIAADAARVVDGGGEGRQSPAGLAWATATSGDRARRAGVAGCSRRARLLAGAAFDPATAGGSPPSRTDRCPRRRLAVATGSAPLGRYCRSPAAFGPNWQPMLATAGQGEADRRQRESPAERRRLAVDHLADIWRHATRTHCGTPQTRLRRRTHREVSLMSGDFTAAADPIRAVRRVA